MLFSDQTGRPSSTAASTTLRDLRPDSVDRVLVPPSDIRQRSAEGLEDLGPYFSVTLKDPGPDDPKKEPRQLFQRVPDEGEYQPLLIAGCRAAETSADIRVENDYHGLSAFSEQALGSRSRGPRKRRS